VHVGYGCDELDFSPSLPTLFCSSLLWGNYCLHMAQTGISQLHYSSLPLAHVVDAQQIKCFGYWNNMWCAYALCTSPSQFLTQSWGLNVKLPPRGSVSSTTAIGRCCMFHNQLEVTFFIYIRTQSEPSERNYLYYIRGYCSTMLVLLVWWSFV